jgi:hypothetical protein
MTDPVAFQPITVTLQPMVHVEDMHQAVVFYEG